MNKTANSYRFRKVLSDDLQLLSTWLKEPMVSRWYHDEDYIDDLAENLEDSRIRMQLVLHDDNPIAYVQDYDIHSWTDHHLAYLPLNSRGIDTFIGCNKWMGKGHGTYYLTLLSTQLFQDGVPALGIDPHPDNVVACRVYEKIGFRYNGVVESEWGTVITMSLTSHQALQ